MARLAGVIVSTGVALGVTVFAATPASASSQNICTSMPTGAVNTLSEGQNRKVSLGNHNHDIIWSFTGTAGCTASFPSGGTLRVRVRFLQANANCTSNTILFDGELRIYTGRQSMTLATDVLPGTCYRIIWRPADAEAANKTLRGTLALRDS